MLTTPDLDVARWLARRLLNRHYKGEYISRVDILYKLDVVESIDYAIPKADPTRENNDTERT